MRRLVAVSFVLVALTTSLLATPATADSTGSNRPVVTVVGGTPAGTAVTVTATINRTSKQIASCLYGVDAAPSIDCGAGASDGAGTRFTVTLLDQSPGEHTINVKVVLTDGGGASGSAGFTIEIAAPHATLDVTKTEDGAAPTDIFEFQLTGGPDGIDVTQSTKPGDGGLEWTDLSAGDYTLCERSMPAAMHSSLEDAPYNGTRASDGAGVVKVCASITLAAGQTLSIPVDNVHGLLAVAWTDNGDHVYQPATDSLIAKLVDTNGDGVVSVGDTITTDQFPRDHDATAFEPATVTTFDVTSALIVNSGQIVAGTTPGLFQWLVQGELEQYQEATLNAGRIVLVDGPEPSCDGISLQEDSPSEITTPATSVTCDGVNSVFLDVAISGS